MYIESKTISFRAKSGDITATLMTPDAFHRGLAIVLPGAAYSCAHPLLYYSIKVLLKNKYRVIALNKLYAEDPQFVEITKTEEALHFVEEDSICLFEQIRDQFLTIDTILAHSLGTYAVACALENELVTPRNIIWQCPSLNSKWNTMKNCPTRSLGIIGTLDERYSLAKTCLPKDRLVIEGADHSLEIPGDPNKTIEILKQVTQKTYDWLAVEAPIDISLTDYSLRLSHEERIENHESALNLVTDLQEAGKTLHETQPKSAP